MTAYGNGECVKFVFYEGVMGTGSLTMVLLRVGGSCFRGEVILLVNLYVNLSG